jgi:hypothetical protein
MVTKKCFKCGIEFTCTGKTFEEITMREADKHCWEIGSCECVDCAVKDIKFLNAKDYYTNLCFRCYGKEVVLEHLSLEVL